LGQQVRHLGMKGTDVERLTLVVTDLERGHEYLILSCFVPFDQEKVKTAIGGGKAPREMKHNNHTLYVMATTFDPVFAAGKSSGVACLLGKRVLLCGNPAAVRLALDAPARTKTTGPIADALQLAARGYSLAGGTIRAESLRKRLDTPAGGQ